MNEKKRKTFLMWSETEEHHRRLEEAKAIIAIALNNFKKPYVAYSGGKDSLCLLHLTLQQKPDVTIIHWDYGPYFMPREIENEILENARKIGAKNIQIYTSNLYLKLQRKARNILGSIFLEKIVPQLAKEGFDCCLLGLRAEESSRRKTKTKNPFKEEKGIINVTPLRSWKWIDCWAYIVKNNLPYPSVYDKYAEVIGYDKARLVTFFDKEFEWTGAPLLDGILMTKHKNINRASR